MSKAAFLRICFSWSCLCFLRDVIFRCATTTGDQLIQRLFDPTEWKCYRKSAYPTQMFPGISIQVKAPFTFGSTPDLWFTLTRRRGGGGEAALPYKSDGGVRRKILRTPLKGTRILFYGCVPYLFPPLRGTNSTTTKYIIGTANFDSNKDIFRTLSSQGRFGNLYWDNSGSSHFRF